MDPCILDDIRLFQTSGDLSARDRVLERFLPLIHKSIRKAIGRKSNTRTEEYLSVAFEAFVHAISKFDLDTYKLSSSYLSQAVYWSVRQQLRLDHGFGDTIARQSQKFYMARNALIRKLLREPTEHELCQHLGLSEQSFRRLQSSAASSKVPIHAPIAEESSITFQDSIPGDTSEDVLRDLESSTTQSLCHSLLQTLSEREQQVLTLRFFEEKNFFEIAEAIGISHQACSTIARKALKKLHLRLTHSGMDLKDFCS